MPVSESAITIGSLRIPTLLVGFSISLAAHAGLLATLAFVSSGHSHASATPPILEFALGEPIRVLIVSEDSLELPIKDEIADISTSTPGVPEELQPIAPLVPADAESLSAPQEPLVDEPIQKLKPLPAYSPGIDWATFVELLRSIDWSSFISSSPRAPTEVSQDQLIGDKKTESQDAPILQPVVSENSERADPAKSPYESIMPKKNSASKKTPQGISQGASIIDLPQPRYPRMSIRLGHEGTAVVEIAVRADGSVEWVRLRISSGHKLLDDEALKAARNGRYGPALRNGQPFDAIVIVPFQFKLTTKR